MLSTPLTGAPCTVHLKKDVRKEWEREIGHSCIKGVFLDELAPGRGRKQDEIAAECGINCELSWLNLKEELSNDEKRR